MSNYLFILAAALLLPLLLSFDKKVAYYTKWKYLFPAIVLTACLFIIWDIYFTQRGIWGFSPKHLSGIYIIKLPVEEWLFFLVIPYASVFTYEVVITYFKRMGNGKAAGTINLVLIGLALIMIVVFRTKAYTLTTFSLMAIMLALQHWLLKSPWMQSFYLSYLLILFPFMVVDGLLTGTFTAGEVVWYNNMETMNLRIGTIPLEDVFYGFVLILVNITLYEAFRRRRIKQKQNPDGSGFSDK